MTPNFISKLPTAGTTIFTTISKMAADHNAINLGQGFPDYNMSEKLITRVSEAMQEGYNQYAPMPGFPPLLQAIADKIKNLYHLSVNHNTEVTITPGGTYAIYTALTTVLQPGDEVIAFEPIYDSYIPAIELCGAIPVLIPLTFPGFKIDWQKVKEAITPKTKMILLNNPHNPTGSILTKEDLLTLQDILKNSPILLMADEVYEHIVFDGQPHESILGYPELYQRSFVCFSFGKTYNCTGWKLGYCVAPEPLTKEFRKIHQFNCFSCNTPAQVGLARFLKNQDEYLGLSKIIQAKRDLFIELMQSTLFDLLPTSGSYFICASYDKISNEKDFDFVVRMIKETGVAAIPLSSFYHNATHHRIIRFCFVKKEETLVAAAERLSRFSK